MLFSPLIPSLASSLIPSLASSLIPSLISSLASSLIPSLIPSLTSSSEPLTAKAVFDAARDGVAPALEAVRQEAERAGSARYPTGTVPRASARSAPAVGEPFSAV
ncbi:hypothetical protein ABZ547_15730 [Streptomyces sparsogenes]|uniref:hypothetical protein n=1 Tax=Streptomyces sparsogenes TaxID=67365 RepID=UPI0033C183BA